ncbi:branched-subunit amino acid aminotransferase/4-amino-4-deoxychorismate lyase [Saccharothrix tamanrassetensis]|uniref:Branched-subunit amino acid aminotransferase/4-amino-4-deoxychorismate lyase n=1 Tax=Saccharothrix tamanrassetensis TaxID=1051531 RepID=A0A841C9J1_9PSEU|nr:aminotransferase class IV [Saccharothrix tamanrassetensis]MBB5954079.1 branched-subunit amino acid aminotransferase/4-amino-4-deoxychorismate lyase [Saccharothrix tamanrassetensis]
MLRIEIDGNPPTAAQLAPAVLANYGHFTAMQVRDRRVRGLDLHLRRLDAANRELYGTGLDGDRVRGLISHALADDVRDAAVRVVVFGPTSPSVLVGVRAPSTPPAHPQRLMSVDYRRPLPHVKHLGGFGQTHHGIRAVAAGFDDALLTTSDGVVVEGTIANIGFLDDTGIVWAEADWLHGITMQLLERQLPSRRAVVRLADLRSYRGAFLTNSIGVVAVSRIDDVEYEVDDAALTRLQAGYDAVPWDAVE